MAYDSRRVALRWRSYWGRKSDSSSLHLRLHEISAIGCSRERISRESLLWDEVNIRHDRRVEGREGANNSPSMGEIGMQISYLLQHSTPLRFMLLVS